MTLCVDRCGGRRLGRGILGNSYMTSNPTIRRTQKARATCRSALHLWYCAPFHQRSRWTDKISRLELSSNATHCMHPHALTSAQRHLSYGISCQLDKDASRDADQGARYPHFFVASFAECYKKKRISARNVVKARAPAQLLRVRLTQRFPSRLAVFCSLR